MGSSNARTFAERYQRVLEIMDDGVLVVGLDDRVLLANPVSQRLLGVSEVPEHGGLKVNWQILDRGERPLPPEQCPFAECRRLGRPVYRDRLGLRRPDGSVVWVSMRCVPDAGPDGTTNQFLVVMRDCSEQRELEWQLAQAQKLETVGILAGNVAHDFNNLLTVISCNVANVMESIPESDLNRPLLLDVQKASEQAAELTHDLLSFSRKTKPRSIICDLSQVAAEAIRLMRYMMPPEVEVHIDFSAEPLRLRGDPAQLHQVIVNLCIAARDAMPEGGTLTMRTFDRSIVDTHCSTNPNARTGEFVVLGIDDPGPELERRMLAQACEPFSPASERQFGLGLLVVRDIVDAHEGWIEVGPLPGADQGTRVEVYFPRRTADDDEPRRSVIREARRGEGLVLIVDNEPMIVALLRTVLESRGYQAITAHTATEAVTQFERHRQSLVAIVLDKELPEIDGGSVFQRLRQSAVQLPIVLTGGNVPVAEADSLPTDEHTRFVAKPFAPPEVLKALKSLCG